MNYIKDFHEQLPADRYLTASRDFYNYKPYGITLREALEGVGIMVSDRQIQFISCRQQRDRMRLYHYIDMNYEDMKYNHTARSTLYWFLVWIL